MEILRTPDDRFAALPDFPYTPVYVTTSDGLRVAVVDEAPRDVPPVLLLHGEPTWSFLYRRMIPTLLAAGHRVVAPDLVGFGRSDKPAHETDHSYAAHVEWMRSALFDDLGLDRVALFCQDWGGLIGLRLVAEHPERFRAVCASNTGLPDGSRRMGPAWQQFKEFIDATPDLPIGMLVGLGCQRGLDAAATAAYDAPFPDVSFKAGPRAMPTLIPQTPDDPAAERQRQAWAALGRATVPVLTLFADGDPITAGQDAALQQRLPGAAGQPHRTIAGAGHFVQEDAGPEVARALADWLAALPA